MSDRPPTGAPLAGAVAVVDFLRYGPFAGSVPPGPALLKPCRAGCRGVAGVLAAGFAVFALGPA
ncbi:hypothetical protein [Streptomyces sp. NPDC091268]|uniref:hypothetical protein n=1 Tax=Streptomyces sp. NPDC091268 TaxID=3365979 RepID=UPI00381F286B